MRVVRKLEQLAKLGFDFHQLMGKPVRYSIHVNGPSCVAFEWKEPHAERIDFENYH
jgi:proteic killer suppression protein